MSTSQKIDFDVRGNFARVSICTTTRDDHPGILLNQSGRWIFVDSETWDRLVDAADALLEDDQAELGKLFRHQLQPAVTPAKWRRNAAD